MGNVLIVDDSSTMRKIISRSLRQAGLQVDDIYEAGDGIEGLSFDIYEPILNSWFGSWQQKAEVQNAIVLMAHSIGDVPLHKSSYVAAVLSPKRKVALALINDFVEDFKASAPIWKYDLRDGKRVYADDRSTPLCGAGLLS